MVAGFNPGKRIARMPDRVQNLICRFGCLPDEHRLSAGRSLIQIVRARIAILLLSLLGLNRVIPLGELQILAPYLDDVACSGGDFVKIRSL